MAKWHGWRSGEGADAFVLRVEDRADRPRPCLTLSDGEVTEVLAYFRSVEHAEMAMAAVDLLLGFSPGEVARAIAEAEAGQ